MKILSQLSLLYPEAHCSLDFADPFQLLVATILSAQCTDERVNRVTPLLFARFPTAAAVAKAPIAELEMLIRSTGFYRNKAKNILEMSQQLMQQGGEVPRQMEALIRLPGVGRKTANVVLGNAFQCPAGVVVDTHVKRLSFRLGLTQASHPEKVEIDLNGLFPQKDWTLVPHLLIQHGRAICKAQRPQCDSCALTALCPKRGLRG